jgi:hypothetical protein
LCSNNYIKFACETQKKNTEVPKDLKDVKVMKRDEKSFEKGM